MNINKPWHERHRMPKNPTLKQRINWHEEHQKQCSCRGIPLKILQAMHKKP